MPDRPQDADDRIRICIVDDDPIVCSALVSYLARAADIDVVEVLSNGRAAVERLLGGRSVDVVLMDIRMPVQDGLSATAEILAADNPPRIILLTSIDIDEVVAEAVRLGANGVLMKSTSPETFVSAVRAVHRGTAVFSESSLPELAPPHDRQPTTSVRFTDRERDVLVLLCRAYSNADIARELHLSESRVKAYVSAVMARLGVDSRLKVVVKAFQENLVPPA